MADTISVRGKVTNLEELGVQPGWFVRYADCSIWFEILRVFGTSLVCVNRDPQKKTDYVSTGSHWSAINELCAEKPSGRWIDRDRNKNFFDKFHPEGKTAWYDNLATASVTVQ